METISDPALQIGALLVALIPPCACLDEESHRSAHDCGEHDTQPWAGSIDGFVSEQMIFGALGVQASGAGARGIISMQSTGQGAMHRSQPVQIRQHCMQVELIAPRIVSTGQGWDALSCSQCSLLR